MSVYAASTSSSSWEKSTPQESREKTASLYDQGVAAHTKGDYQKALSLFEQALNSDRDNPDIINMIAHCQLKLGKIDDSIATYGKALSLRPRFPEAREYLGEAYLQAALRELQTLKGYGSEATEEEQDLREALREALERL